MKEVPNKLLRFWKLEGHARAFIEGKLHFGLLDHYRTIEGSRQDDKEGLTSFYWNLKAPEVTICTKTGKIVGRGISKENIHYSGSSINPYFILSVAHPDADPQILASKYGNFIIQIDEPEVLLQRIKLAWHTHPWSLNGYAELAEVIYNKDEILEPDPFLLGPSDHSYTQKHKSHGEGRDFRSYEEDKEYRYVLECSIDANRKMEDHLVLRVPNCSDICSLIDAAQQRLS